MGTAAEMLANAKAAVLQEGLQAIRIKQAPKPFPEWRHESIFDG